MQSPVRLSKFLLLTGDLVCFVVALWLSLVLRSLAVPQSEFFTDYLTAFVPLFIVWTLVFFIAGLYEERRILFGTRTLSSVLLYAQVANVIIAALFFFLIPSFGFAPKTVLLIYLTISFALVFLWRSRIFINLGLQRAERAIMIGSGELITELVGALNHSLYSPVRVAATIPAQGAELARPDGGSDDRAERLPLAVLDSLREVDLALAGEERHLAHLLQVHPDRVVQDVVLGGE